MNGREKKNDRKRERERKRAYKMQEEKRKKKIMDETMCWYFSGYDILFF